MACEGREEVEAEGDRKHEVCSLDRLETLEAEMHEEADA